MGLSHNEPYILEDIYKSDGEPVFVLKTIQGKKAVI